MQIKQQNIQLYREHTLIHGYIILNFNDISYFPLQRASKVAITSAKLFTFSFSKDHIFSLKMKLFSMLQSLPLRMDTSYFSNCSILVSLQILLILEALDIFVKIIFLFLINLNSSIYFCCIYVINFKSLLLYISLWIK